MRDVTVGKNIHSNLVAAYIAGFLDGDGAICANIERHSEKKFKFRVRISLDFYQHKKNVSELKFIRNALGEGYLGKSNRNTQKLSLKNQSTLKTILPELHRFTQIKKKQIEIALEILNISIETKEDLIKVAKMADKLSRLNIRASARRKNSSKIIV